MSWVGVAAAAVSAGAGLYASKQAKKKSKSEKKYQDLLSRNTELASGYGTDLLDRSRSTLGPVQDWYTKLSTGDRESLSALFAPEISARADASRRAYQTGMELSPRSGISTERNTRIPMDDASFIADLMRSGRSEGIKGLATLGTNWGSLGMSGLAQGGAGAGQLLGFEGARRDRASQAGRDAGESAYAIYRLINDAYSGRKSGNNNAFWSSAYRGDYGPGGTYGAGGFGFGG